MITFPQFKAARDFLESAMITATEHLKAVESDMGAKRSGCGLIDDATRLNPAWREAATKERAAFEEIRTLNGKYAKHFKAEIRAEIQAKREQRKAVTA